MEAVRFSKSVAGHSLSMRIVMWLVAAAFAGAMTDANAQIKDGINVLTGTHIEIVTDIPGEGHLSFTRHYSSANIPRNPGSTMGPRWRHSFQASIVVESYSLVRLNRPSGNSYNFRNHYPWAPDPDVRERLAMNAAGDRWRATLPDGRVEQFTLAGRLERIEYPDGDILTVTSDASARPISVRDSRGRVLTFTYLGELLDSVTGPDGVTVAYAYDAQRRLTRTTKSASPATSPVSKTVYTYEDPLDPQLLTGIVDEAGQPYGSWSYDNLGRVIAARRGAGESVFNYGANQVQVTDPNGATTSYGLGYRYGRAQVPSEQTTCSACTWPASSTTYDLNGYRDKVVDSRGAMTDFDYNARGLLVKQIDASSDAAAKRTIEIVWHPKLPMPAERRTLDAAGQIIAKDIWSRNARGQVTSQAQTDPFSSESRTVTTQYCEQADVTAGQCPLVGLVRSIDGERTNINDITTFQYYPTDHSDCASSPTTCAWRKGDLWKVTNAIGHVTETRRYDGAGRVLSVKDPNGVITDFEYHARGWLAALKVRGVDAATEADDQITRIDYYPTGLVSSTTLPDGSFTSYVYDAAHRLIDIVDADGNRIHHTLDNAGNRIKEEVRGREDSLKRTLSRVYNQLGQLQTAKDAGGHPTGFTYDASGNPDTTTDALGRVTNNDHDPLNRLSRTQQDVGGINAETRFHYDAQDNLTEVVDPKGLSTKYTYNAFGDLTKLESPNTGITTYGYDSAGNRTSSLDARGELARYGYDALNRLTSIGYSDASLDVAYSYDTVQPECTATESFAVGRLTRMSDGSGSTRYCYDQFGNLTRKVQVTNGQTFALRYAYTRSGQLSGMEYPDGTVVDYVRDGLGQVNEVGVTLPGSTRQVLLTGASYHPFGPIAGWTFGNGRTMVRTLDLDYRPKAILSTGTGAGGLNLGYGWDAVGNMGSLHASGLEQPPKVRFSYDALNRLTEFQDGPTGVAIEKYGYDATGNRTSFTNANGTVAYAYPADSHRLTAVAGVSRRYDAAGNTISVGGTSREFEYSSAGRMDRVQRDNVVAMQYGYNGQGERVRKYLAANSTYAIYDEAGHWVGLYGTSGAPDQQVIWLDDFPVGLIAKAQLNYIEPDHLGTPRVVIQPQRDVAVWTWDLAGEAFGSSAPSQDPDADARNFELGMRFPGQLYDDETGLNNNYFRDYDFGSGRYAQSDPIGLGGGASTYGYVEGNPIAAVDAFGLQAVRPPRVAPAQGGPNIYIGPVRGLIREIKLYNPSFTYQRIGPLGQTYNRSDYAYLTRVLSQQRYEYQTRHPNSCPSGAGAPPSPYSVAFETAIPKVGSGRRTSHNVAANRALTNEMERDPSFALMMSQLGISPAPRADQSPSGWSWHHTSGRPGVMQLVPRQQHESSPYRPALHPNNGRGGFYEWGADY